MIFGGSAADVRSPVVGGRQVVAGGRHQLIDDLPRRLADAILAVAQ